MYMFQSFLSSIPKNRLGMVNDLEIPEITLEPYVWTEPEETFSVMSDSTLTDSMAECDRGTLSTDSSIPLSRAMTDSEIDYGFYKRFKNCGFSDPCDHMRAAVDAFPPDYIASLNSYISTDTEEELAEAAAADAAYAAELRESRRRYNDVWRRRMRKYFDEDCRVFSYDDPSLLELQDALRSLDMKVLALKALEADLARIGPSY